MKIFDMLRFVVEPREHAKPAIVEGVQSFQARDFISLFSPDADKRHRRVYVVAEETRLMGHQEQNFSNGEKIITLKTGDEIILFNYEPVTSDEKEDSWILGREIQERVCMVVRNAEHTDTDQRFYFLRSHLENKKIMIKIGAKLEYSSIQD